MTEFLLALQFLTVIPVRIKEVNDKKISQSMAYFPVIGLLLGLILVGLNNFLCFLKFEHFLVNIFLVISLIILTGGLHLDGLADTIDAVLSRKGKEDMLAVMRDSRIGTMGALSLNIILLLKIALLTSMGTSLKMPSLVLMCTISRWALVFAVKLFPYARKEGKAKAFFQGINLKILLLATAFTLICAVFILRWMGLISLIISALSIYLFGKFITRRIAGITGDALGAVNEVTEVIVLLSIRTLSVFSG